MHGKRAVRLIDFPGISHGRADAARAALRTFVTAEKVHTRGVAALLLVVPLGRITVDDHNAYLGAKEVADSERVPLYLAVTRCDTDEPDTWWREVQKLHDWRCDEVVGMCAVTDEFLERKVDEAMRLTQ